jgi:hypothetical protein
MRDFNVLAPTAVQRLRVRLRNRLLESESRSRAREERKGPKRWPMKRGSFAHGAPTEMPVLERSRCKEMKR